MKIRLNKIGMLPVTINRYISVNSGEREPLIPVNVNPLKRAHEVNFKRTI